MCGVLLAYIGGNISGLVKDPAGIAFFVLNTSGIAKVRKNLNRLGIYRYHGAEKDTP